MIPKAITTLQGINHFILNCFVDAMFAYFHLFCHGEPDISKLYKTSVRLSLQHSVLNHSIVTVKKVFHDILLVGRE